MLGHILFLWTAIDLPPKSTCPFIRRLSYVEMFSIIGHLLFVSRITFFFSKLTAAWNATLRLIGSTRQFRGCNSTEQVYPLTYERRDTRKKELSIPLKKIPSALLPPIITIRSYIKFSITATAASTFASSSSFLMMVCGGLCGFQSDLPFMTFGLS